MKSYKTKTPRATFGLAAAAMTALTFGLLVAAPMHAHTDAPVVLAQASTPSTASTPTVVAIYPARIEVVATRTAALTAQPALESAPKAKTQG